MDFSELVLESLGMLTVNRLRTGLAVLGIVIGIGSVIALISLGQATQQAVTSQIQSLGSNDGSTGSNYAGRHKRRSRRQHYIDSG